MEVETVIRLKRQFCACVFDICSCDFSKQLFISRPFSKQSWAEWCMWLEDLVKGTVHFILFFSLCLFSNRSSNSGTKFCNCSKYGHRNNGFSITWSYLYLNIFPTDGPLLSLECDLKAGIASLCLSNCIQMRLTNEVLFI